MNLVEFIVSINSAYKIGNHSSLSTSLSITVFNPSLNFTDPTSKYLPYPISWSDAICYFFFFFKEFVTCHHIYSFDLLRGFHLACLSPPDPSSTSGPERLCSVLISSCLLNISLCFLLAFLVGAQPDSPAPLLTTSSLVAFLVTIWKPFLSTCYLHALLMLFPLAGLFFQLSPACCLHTYFSRFTGSLIFGSFFSSTKLVTLLFVVLFFHDTLYMHILAIVLYRHMSEILQVSFQTTTIK